MKKEFSETGFLILCDYCGEHTAQYCYDDTDYHCTFCVTAPAQTSNDWKICDCGATKAGVTHSDWCSTQNDN